MIALVVVWVGSSVLPILAQTNTTEFGKGALRPGEGVTAPTPVSKVEPKYTRAAEKAAIQGPVVLEAVVQVDGTVGEARIIRSLDALYGLDDQALTCARQWRFKPGQRASVPVPVFATLLIEFRLKDGRAASVVDEEDFEAGASKEGDPGVVLPKLIRRTSPVYPAAAMGARINGDVVLEAVVLTDGTVGRLRLVRSLDEVARIAGFDQSAAWALKQWRFESGRKHGFPVPVIIRVEMAFLIKEHLQPA